MQENKQTRMGFIFVVSSFQPAYDNSHLPNITVTEIYTADQKPGSCSVYSRMGAHGR